MLIILGKKHKYLSKVWLELNVEKNVNLLCSSRANHDQNARYNYRRTVKTIDSSEFVSRAVNIIKIIFTNKLRVD